MAPAGLLLAVGGQSRGMSTSIEVTPHTDLLAIYLTDHLAGAAAGSRRMRRLAEAERDADDGRDLARIADEIEQDRVALRSMIDEAGISLRWYKSLAARAVEAAGMLKLNGTVLRRSPLTSVLELELMRMAVTGKLALWGALHDTPLTERHDFDVLIDRARAQLRDLEVAHTRRTGVLGSAMMTGSHV